MFTLDKLAYCACTGAQRLWYAAAVGEIRDLRPCCVRLVEFAKENAKPLDASVCLEAAEAGHADCLKYAREAGRCPWDGRTCATAAWNGRLDCLRLARDRGCPWDERTCEKAAASGRLECLRYARDRGCPWDERTCSGASGGGHLECLRYARERGCPWDELTIANAVGAGHFHCSQYAYEHGCERDSLFYPATTRVFPSVPGFLRDLTEVFGIPRACSVDPILTDDFNDGRIRKYRLYGRPR